MNTTTTAQENFFTKIPGNNVEFAAQQLNHEFNGASFKSLKRCFEKMDVTLFKSWSKQMTFEELYEAVKLVEENRK